jgi:DNA-binding NarL/FixJ family response regulator
LATCVALGPLEAHSADVAIVDIHLQDGSCEPVARRLAEMGTLYVVFSAGAPDEAHEEPVFQVDGWLQKQARPDQVTRAGTA